MLDDFIVRAALAGVGTSVAAGLLGVFVVWRRMAYFGDATAHAAILGVALALTLTLPVTAGVLAVALVAAMAVHALTDRTAAGDTVLGVVSHGALALGLVAVALAPGARVNLESYLFGDVLTVSRTDLAVIWGGTALVGAVIFWRWSLLLTATVSPELSHAAGIDPRREHLVLSLMIAAMVAVGIKVVGALLITALLIIPAAAARPLSRTPEGMAGAAVAIGAGASLAGLWAAFVLDTPVGPSVVAVAVAVYVLSRALAPVLRRA